MQVLGAEATNANATVTITDPGAGRGTIHLVFIAAAYTSGSSTGTLNKLTVKQGTLPTVLSRSVVNIPVGPDEMSQYQCQFPTGSGNVVVQLGAGGANVNGVCLVGWCII